MPNDLIDSLLKSEAATLDTAELRSLINNHLEINDDTGELELTADHIRLIAKGDLILEDGKQQITLDAIAYAFNTAIRLERQMSLILQILIEKEGAGPFLNRLTGIARLTEKERDR